MAAEGNKFPFSAVGTDVHGADYPENFVAVKRCRVDRSKTGTRGAAIAKPLNEITFFDVYQSVDCIAENTLFHFHENPNPNCPVGKNIHQVLDDKLRRIQAAMEQELKSITLDDMNSDLKKCLKEKS